jgi:hypothetical protein
MLNKQLEAHRTAEGAIRAAALAANSSIQVKADALAEERREFEQEKADWKRKADAAALKAFCDSVSAVASRMDALERARQDEELRKLPDPDAACDFLPPAVLEAPGPKHREQERELEGAEEAIAEDGLELRHEDMDGDLGIPAVPSSLSAIMGEPFAGGRLPENTVFPVKSDGFVCARDRRAHRRRMRQLQGLVN